MDARQIDPFGFDPQAQVPEPAPAPPPASFPAQVVSDVPVLTLDEIATLERVPLVDVLPDATEQVPEYEPAAVTVPIPVPVQAPSASTSVDEPARLEHDLLRDEARLQRLRRYQHQEERRAPKVQIDQRLVLWLWIAGISLAFVSSAIVSYNGITAVAQFVGLSQAWMGGLFFFFIELMYLLFLIAYLVLASRVDDNGRKEKTFGAVLGMFAFGVVAVVANAFHTLNYWNFDWAEPRLWAGTMLSVAAPLAIISASKMASRVVFAKAIVLN
jgi:hypothetical protein